MPSSSARARFLANETQDIDRRGDRMAGKLLLAVCAIVSLAIIASAQPARAADSVIYAVDFSGFPGGSVLQWLGSKEFLPKQDANNDRRVVYSASQSDLLLETRSRVCRPAQ
jgi:inosine/xanthosine triphosphate pyrophosphatase family protein